MWACSTRLGVRGKNEQAIDRYFASCIEITCVLLFRVLGIVASHQLALNSLRRRYNIFFINWGLGAQTGLGSGSLQSLVLSLGEERNLWPVRIYANRRLFLYRSRHVLCAEPDDLAQNCLSRFVHEAGNKKIFACISTVDGSRSPVTHIC